MPRWSEPSVRRTLRFTKTMDARLEHYAAELGLPTVTALVNQACSTYLDNLVAQRGEAYASRATAREVQAHYARLDAARPAAPTAPAAAARPASKRRTTASGTTPERAAALFHAEGTPPYSRRRARR